MVETDRGCLCRGRVSRSAQVSRREGKKISSGAVVPRREITTVSGEPISIPDTQYLIHLQLRRFAGCPVCNLHLQSIVRRHDEILARGIREVVVFHSSAQELLVHTKRLPFAVIADPQKRLYAEFGAEATPRAVLDPRAWVPIIRGISLCLWEIAGKRGYVPSINPSGGRFGLPADFLIATDGRVLAAHYGDHAYDQWSVNELLELGPRQNPQLGQ